MEGLAPITRTMRSDLGVMGLHRPFPKTLGCTLDRDRPLSRATCMSRQAGPCGQRHSDTQRHAEEGQGRATSLQTDVDLCHCTSNTTSDTQSVDVNECDVKVLNI